MSCALSSFRSCSAPANGSSTRPPPGYPSAWSTPGPSATASSSSPTNQPELRSARPPASVLRPARRTEASLPTKRRVSSLPLPDASFDAVLCSLALQFFPDKVAALEEARRVLAPGGRVAIGTPGPIPPLMADLHEVIDRHLGAEAAGFVHA